VLSSLRFFFKSSFLWIWPLFLISLHACSLFKPVKIEPVNYYTVSTPLSCTNTRCVRNRKTILITLPRANAIYSNPRMIYIPDCYQLQYFAHSRWADTPPQLLHPLLIKSLQNTGYFNAIINTPSTTHYDFILHTQLLSFQQEFLTAPSVFRIALRAQLINAHTDKIVATEDFMVTQKALIDSPHGGAIAANCAVRRILKQINNFCLDWIL
jgi:cholesterol transport system auxiliary component